ncbi:MAG: 4Fe-4S double cluster binding domain-containing protein [Acidobacteriota bacterium]
MIDALLRWARERGYSVAWGPAEVVQEARAEIARRHASAELDEEFYRGELQALARGEPLRDCGTVVVVSMPRPAHLIGFEVDGARFEALLPPTYFRYRQTFEEVRQDLETSGLAGARVEHFVWPLKAVAARLGLVRYGRNNIAYAEDFGSYMQLCGYLTGARLPVPQGWSPCEPELLAECENCAACLAACPTGAIGDDRVLLHGERCLTHLNENAGEWPAGLPGSSHHCMIGCLLCQRICPANPELPIERTALSFSAADTRSLLGESAPDGYGPETGIRHKLAWLGQPAMGDVLGRNLRALMAARGAVQAASRATSTR